AFEHGQLEVGPADVDAEVAGGHEPFRRRRSSMMAAVAVAPQRSTPGFRPSMSSAGVRMPPAALPLPRSETLARIRRRSSMVEPEGANPVEVFTKSAPALSPHPARAPPPLLLRRVAGLC